ncbi:MAG: hypothetical protein ACF8Q5_02315, partial [Phycisphaerales bacterium JB040]
MTTLAGSSLATLAREAGVPLASQGALPGNLIWWIGVPLAFLFLFIFIIVVVNALYKRCPSNRILVIYGRVGTGRAAKCLHGGGSLVIPLIQNYAYMSLDPLTIDIPLEGALSLNNIR